MSSKPKLPVLTHKIKESKLNFVDELYLSSSEEEIGFQYFFHDQIENDFVEDSSEAELKARTMWNSLDSVLKKTYLKSTKEEEILSDNRKVKSRKSKRSPSPIVKRLKKEYSENGTVTKSENENERLFQMEIQRLVASPAQYCFQPVCCICEIHTENRIVLQCSNVCKRYFHVNCLKQLTDDHSTSNFQCIDCLSGKYRCILCGIFDGLSSLLYCENSDCGRLYHRKCLDQEPFCGLEVLEDRIRSCPAHYCYSCVREDSSYAQNPCKKLIECLRCPLSFHCNDICMAAGAFELSLSHVVCPRHFQSKLVKMSTHKPFHPSWCFKCFKMGVKLLCIYCPSSFHVECVTNCKDLSEANTKEYVCDNCRNYLQPRYGEVLFVKVSQYRWWPCEIIHPRNAPMNILKLNRPDGTYPVLFLGSNEYQWVAKTRSIDYNTAQKSSIFRDSGGSNKMDREFTIGLKSAMKIHQVYVNIVLNYVPLKSISAPSMTDEELYPYLNVKENHKTIKYKPIKASNVVPPAKLPQKIQPSPCDCVDSCQLFKCKNYLKKVECQMYICPTKSQCHNQQFTNYVNKNLAIFKTANRGFGFKTMVSIKKNEFIIEYVGDIITKSESIIRMQNSKKCNMKEFYMIKLTNDLIIDAGPKGNLSRYINHSCDPNCYLEKWIVGGYPRIGVFALKEIEPDQELTFDYRISGVIMKEDTFCLCGSLNCTGFLGPIKSLSNSPVKSLIPTRNFSTPLTVEITEKLSIINQKEDSVHSSKEDSLSHPPPATASRTSLPLSPPPAQETSKSTDPLFMDIPWDQSRENVETERSGSEDSKTNHENFCYRCFDGGELVLCDKNNCPKTYHLSCLGLKNAPSGTWFCPWHFCDICGKPSVTFCLQCPGSFCEFHNNDTNIYPVVTKGSRLSICKRHPQSENFHNTIKLKSDNQPLFQIQQ